MGDHRKVQMNEFNELRDQACKNSLIYKEKTKKKFMYSQDLRTIVFNVGDRVLLFNSRLKIFSGKLKTRWTGPFTIAQVFSYGVVELSQTDGPNFKVNGHRLKYYSGGDIPPMIACIKKTQHKLINRIKLPVRLCLNIGLRLEIIWGDSPHIEDNVSSLEYWDLSIHLLHLHVFHITR
ncbi:hypothetical protein Tco_0870281 [Tanacetum coccineum]